MRNGASRKISSWIAGSALGLITFAFTSAASACAVVATPLIVATPLALGFYNAASASDTTINSTITVSCTVLTSALPPFTVGLSTGAGGGFSPRKMTFGSSTLNYNLYTTGSYADVWGDGSGTTVMQSYSAGAGTTNFTVYGKIPKGQYVAAGLYTDTITVTITY